MFTKASKKQSRLRLALVGPSGSGKTYSALAIAAGLGKKVALLDTERGSAAKYAGLFGDFDHAELGNHHPQRFIDAIAEAERAEYDVLVIDSLSHAWVGRDGALELVDAAARRSKAGNSFAAWRDVTPIQNSLIDAILRSRLHIIATMRAKTEYVVEAGPNGKLVPRKVGLAPVQRDGVEYEFDVVGELDNDHNLAVTKSRCPALTGVVISKPGLQLARSLTVWLEDGTPVQPNPVVAEAVLQKPGNGTIATLAPVAQVKVLISEAKSESDLRALWGRIRALPARDQTQLRETYAAKKEELNVHHHHRQ
jgi:hypothetical protein